MGSRLSAPDAIKALLGEAGVMSLLLVPVLANGSRWGTLTFEDCQGERSWTSEQLSALRILAELIGTAVTRERSLEDVRQRDELLQAVTASATDIMTAPYLHEAISRSLETVAKAVRAHRMHVFEVTQNDGAIQYLLRNAWNEPAAPLELDTILRVMSNPSAPEILEWSAPLSRGHAVKGTLNGAAGALKDLFTRLKLQSTLMVPIMVDGKFWGHVTFDDCHRERVWTQTEIEILKTLAEVIGTAITRERYVEELGKANTIIQNSPTILFRLRGEPSLPMIYVSQNVSALGYDPNELISSPTLYRSFVHPEDRAKVQTVMVEILRKHAPPATIEYRMLTRAGDSRWVESLYTPVRDTNGRLIEVEGVMIDITERKLAEEKIGLLARTDPLTGLANRATFGDRLRHFFAATRRGAKSFAVIYLDLDRFKEVNDTLGHPIGDKLLQAVAGRLKELTRETDVVARLGGDEFAILQSDVTDPSMTGTLARKIIDSLSAPYMIEANEVHIGASVGITLCGADISEPDLLLSQADQALYRAKEEGRGRFRFHSDEIDLKTREHVALVDDLRKALQRGELELHYQPQVELSTGRVVGMEALVRWNHPSRGLLLPEVFLPIAEKSGLIQALGRWVLDGACQQLAAWRQAEMDVPVIAVNVALAQIKLGRDFIRDVKESLERWGLQPSDLELDVTELILARTTLSQSGVLDELRALGVGIAIDDFGAQYSSLDYLRTYHVNRLKIARPMVAAATSGPGGSAMIRAILSLASELGVEVIAEGVETRDQRDLLAATSAKAQAQGFYFSPAVPAGATDTLLESGHFTKKTPPRKKPATPRKR
jgi:diguanylate cyclase (GGDEF)-like protein/PAS domain S-box-containing protein